VALPATSMATTAAEVNPGASSAAATVQLSPTRVALRVTRAEVSTLLKVTVTPMTPDKASVAVPLIVDAGTGTPGIGDGSRTAPAVAGRVDPTTTSSRGQRPLPPCTRALRRGLQRSLPDLASAMARWTIRAIGRLSARGR
jgi:hypothetical protein